MSAFPATITIITQEQEKENPHKSGACDIGDLVMHDVGSNTFGVTVVQLKTDRGFIRITVVSRVSVTCTGTANLILILKVINLMFHKRFADVQSGSSLDYALQEIIFRESPCIQLSFCCMCRGGFKKDTHKTTKHRFLVLKYLNKSTTQHILMFKIFSRN